MLIRFDASSYKDTENKSGVGYYSMRLASALKSKSNVLEVSGPFANFSFGNKLYRKLSSYGIVPAFDHFKQTVDLTVFPNFDCWRNVNSRLTAVVIHDLTYLYYPELVEKANLRHLRRVVPRAINRADVVITVSESVKKELMKEYGIPASRCIVTHVPPDEKFYTPTPLSPNEIFSRFSIPTNRYIYFIGNLDPRKNITSLVKAYRRLPNKLRKEYSLVIAGGSGWDSESTQRLINKAKAEGVSIIQLGYVDDRDAVALMQYANLLVMPSVYEGFGMPIAEAFACKTPVVASDIPVLRETAGEGALFVPPKDWVELANAIESVLTSSTLQSNLIKKGSLQLGSFSWDKNTNTIINHAQTLLDSREVY